MLNSKHWYSLVKKVLAIVGNPSFAVVTVFDEVQVHEKFRLIV